MIKERVQQALDKVRPMLQQDGGDVELVEVDEDSGIVKVNLTGACKGCPMSQITLKSGSGFRGSKVQGLKVQGFNVSVYRVMEMRDGG